MSGARLTEAELKAQGYVRDKRGDWEKPRELIKTWQTGGIPTKLKIEKAVAEIDKPKVTAKASADTSPKYKSKLERRFAEEWLTPRQQTLRWAYEPEKFKLGTGAWYCPDFREILPDGEIIFYEVKGFWRDAAKVRIKVAASRHPYKFFVATWDKKAKYWNIEEVKT